MVAVTVDVADGLALAEQGNDATRVWAAGMRTAIKANPDAIVKTDLTDIALEARVVALERFAPLTPSGGDDTAMLLDKVAELEASGDPTAVLKLRGVFQTTKPLVVSSLHVDGIAAEMRTTADVAVQIGTPEQSCDGKRLDLPALIGGGPTSGVGLKIVAADACQFTVHSRGFGFPVLVAADGQGVAYNVFTLSWVYGHYGIVVKPTGTGWVNQNLFLGGQLMTDNKPGSRAILIDWSREGSQPNNNTWLNMSVESGEVMVETNGFADVFINPRFEGTAACPARWIYQYPAQGNVVVGGVNVYRLEVDDSALPPHLRATNEWVNGY